MSVDPARVNSVGDLVLTEAREFRALADRLRLTLFDLVRRRGPVTGGALAELVGENRGAVGHLRELETVGLVEPHAADDGELSWTSTVNGIYFEIPGDPEAQRAARDLSNVMLAKYSALPTAWVREEEPKLDVEWARAAGLFNARVELTADELRAVQAELERLLERYTSRSTEDTPTGAALVRILAYFLPEPEPAAQSGE